MRSVLLLSKFAYMDNFVSAPEYYIHIVSFLELYQEFLQLGAAEICEDDPSPSADDLADQILEVLNYFG